MNWKIWNICLAVIGGVFISINAWAGGYKHFVEYQGKRLDFAYYVPESVTAKADAIILVPGLNGRGEQMIDDKWMALSDKTGRPIIAPSFVFEGDAAFRKEKSYQYPKVWSGGALNAILDAFANKGIRIRYLYMAGFSAGAQFVGRYALANPNQVAKCAIGAAGGNDPIDYRSPVKFFYAIGENEESNRRQISDIFMKQAATYGVSVDRKIYPNVGHTYTAEMEDDFIRFLEK